MSAILLLIVVLAAANVEASETCDRKLDLAFVVDGSTTVCGGTEQCPNWNAILQFYKDIVSSLTIGKDDTRVAFITAFNKVEVKWNLMQYTDDTTLLSAIDSVKYIGGEFTLLGLLSTHVYFTEVFNPVFGDRADAQNVIVIITDGVPNISPKIAASTSSVLQVAGIAMFVVCLSPGCTEQLAQGTASPPKKANETYFMWNDYFSLYQVRDNLVKNICSFEMPPISILGLISGK